MNKSKLIKYGLIGMAGLASIFLLKNCNSKLSPLMKFFTGVDKVAYKIDTLYIPGDTIQNTITIEKPTPKYIYRTVELRDTVIKVVTGITQTDTITIKAPTTPPNDQINVYLDTIRNDTFNLKYTIVTHGDLLLFNQDFKYINQPKSIVIKRYNPPFSIEPMAGFTSEGYAAIGLKLKVSNFTASYIRFNKQLNGSMYLAGYEFRF